MKLGKSSLRKSLQATPVRRLSFAFVVAIAGPAWPNFIRKAGLREVMELYAALITMGLVGLMSAGCSKPEDESEKIRSAWAFNASGFVALNARDYPAACSNFTKAIELNRDFADAYFGRGAGKDRLNDLTGAVADYDKAIELNPQDGKYYCNRGQVKFVLRKIPEALADYAKAVELEPQISETYFNRGTLQVLALTNYAGALADFTKAIDLHSDPHEEDVYYWRGVAKHLLKDYAGAVADYTRSIELNTNVEWSLALCARTNLDSARKQMLESGKN